MKASSVMQLDGKREGATMGGFQTVSSTIFKGLQAAVASTWLESEVSTTEGARVVSALERNGIAQILTHTQGMMQLQNDFGTGETTFFVVDEDQANNDEDLLGQLGGKWILTVPLVMACVANRFPPPRLLLNDGCGLDPSTAVVPMKSTCMKQLTICATGFRSAVKKELAKKVLACGGAFQLGFNPHPHILIAASSNSEKYRAAVKYKIPVLTLDFVDECWNRGKLQPQNKYTLPPFQGLTICVSGKDLVGSKRDEIARLTTKNGGTYSKDLDRKVTHLVCSHSAKQGEKYKLAVKLDIPIISSKWIFMCDDRQVRLDEAGFSVRDGPQSSNPSSRQTPPASTTTNFPATTTATSTRGEPVMSRLNPGSHSNKIPSAVETSGRILATVEESSALRVINQKANTPRLRSTIPNEGDVDVVTSKLNANASNENYLGAKFPDQNQDYESVYVPSEADLKQGERDAASGFSAWNCFWGTAVLMAGFSNTNKSRIQRIINLLGGFCVDEIAIGLFISNKTELAGTKRLTSALGAPIETNSLQRRLESSAGLATGDEMKVNAMKLGQFCPVIVLGNKGLKQCVARDVIAACIRSGYAQATTARWLLRCFREREMPPLSDFALTDKELNTVFSGRALRETDENEEPEGYGIAPRVEDNEHISAEDEIDDRLESWTVVCTWRNKVVACHNDLPAHDLSEIKSAFEDADLVRDGGMGDSIDYLVCPDSIPASKLPRDKRNIRIVSLEWVITALRVNELIDPNQSPLFRPLEHNVCRVLDGDVVCPTEYNASDRVEIELVCGKLGASYQETLLKQTTHLISPKLEKSNPKVEKAREWGIHIVTIEWLRDTLRRNAKSSEKMFSLEDPKETEQQVSPSPRGLPVSSARPPYTRKTGRQGKDVHSKTQRGGYRGLTLEKSSQGVGSGNGIAKRARTSTKPVARSMNHTGLISPDARNKRRLEDEKSGASSFQSKYTKQSTAKNDFSSWDSMFDMPESMIRMSNGGQHVGSDSANASNRTVQVTAANAAISKEKNDTHPSDPLQEQTVSGTEPASQNDLEKPIQDSVLATVVTPSPANPASLAIEALSQRKGKFSHEDDQSKSPSKRSVLGELRMKSRTRMATQLEREAMNLEEDTRTQGPSLSLNLTANTASPEDEDKQAKRTRTSSRLRQKKATQPSSARPDHNSGDNGPSSLEPPPQHPPLQLLQQHKQKHSTLRGRSSLNHAYGILQHQSGWFPESRGDEPAEGRHRAQLGSGDVVINTQEMVVEIGWGDGNTNVEALEESAVPLALNSNGDGDQDDGHDGSEMRVHERSSKSRRGLASKLNQIGELTCKRRLQR